MQTNSIPNLTTEQKELFWSRVEVPFQPSDCWEWKGGRDKGGYGKLKLAGVWYKSHRIAYFLFDPTFDQSLLICHQCDNPSCVNPNHLFVGTSADNMRDMKEKGRDCGNKIRGGSLNPGAKLSEKDVIEIRSMYPGTTQIEIAKKFGIHQATVSEIIRKVSWTQI